MKIAVIGSAVDGSQVAREIGHYLAEAGHVLLTGACSGSPGEAETAAIEAGGTVLGYSPAGNEEDHVKLGLPARAGRPTIFTNRGFKGRNVDMVMASDAVIMIGGRLGTLNEAIISVEENRPLLVLETGGATHWIRQIVEDLRPDYINRIILCQSVEDVADRLAEV